MSPYLSLQNENGRLATNGIDRRWHETLSIFYILISEAWNAFDQVRSIRQYL